MWPLVAALLLGSLCCGSSQLLFNEIKSVEFTICNETVVIPCFVSNGAARSIKELYVRWKFNEKSILDFDGAVDRFSRDDNFLSAEIDSSELLKGDASLKLDKGDAVIGNYTCEVTELSREGKTVIELKYRVVSWFPLSQNILIITFPILAILLFWGQYGLLALKYKFNLRIAKLLVLSVGGLLITAIVIVAAILFSPGEYSEKKANALRFLVSPSVILIFLHYFKFTPAIGMTFYTMITLTVIQALGYVLAMAGVYLCMSVCTPVYGSLLIFGLGIIALAELLGLVYIKFAPPLI